MADIKIIVGLGNIGRDYEQTRHNAGFWFVDRLALQYAGNFAPEKRFNADLCKIAIAGHQVWLLKPRTLMNLSGQSVSGLANFYKIDVSGILVVHDELDMMPGQARFKKGGGVAGHNGLKDIRARCGGDGFLRLRLGIGHPRELGLRQQAADFVLKRPSADHQIVIDQAIEHGINALPLLLSGSVEDAMQDLHSHTGKPISPG